MTAESKHGSSRAYRAAEQVVRRLQQAGYTAYFAGGCVRDMRLGIEPVDYDVATEARPPQVVELFRHSRLVGEAFGVVLVRLMGCDVEVATFRDGRRPDHVDFSDARHDAHRRDFTVNGMFYDPLADRLIDYVGGQEDLRRRVIRCIGEPAQRFDEDYLRMLRAVRFAARLGWPIDPATAQAIADHAPRLARISRERIGMEEALRLNLVNVVADPEELWSAAEDLIGRLKKRPARALGLSKRLVDLSASVDEMTSFEIETLAQTGALAAPDFPQILTEGIQQLQKKK